MPMTARFAPSPRELKLLMILVKPSPDGKSHMMIIARTNRPPMTDNLREFSTALAMMMTPIKNSNTATAIWSMTPRLIIAFPPLIYLTKPDISDPMPTPLGAALLIHGKLLLQRTAMPASIVPSRRIFSIWIL